MNFPVITFLCRFVSILKTVQLFFMCVYLRRYACIKYKISAKSSPVCQQQPGLPKTDEFGCDKEGAGTTLLLAVFCQQQQTPETGHGTSLRERAVLIAARMEAAWSALPSFSCPSKMACIWCCPSGTFEVSPRTLIHVEITLKMGLNGTMHCEVN